MLYAYDLDGTLAYTREAVLTAYRAAGVEPPSDFFGKPWREWLQDEEIHRLKNAYYAQFCAKHIIPTKILDLYQRTGGMIITGASREAAEVVMTAIGINPEIVCCELSKTQKVEYLNDFVRLTGTAPGIVFEDSPAIAKHLKEFTEWTVCLVL
jgi:hypothetical protein